jgi:endoglucanase
MKPNVHMTPEIALIKPTIPVCTLSKQAVPVCTALRGGKAGTLCLLVGIAILLIAVSPRSALAQEAIWNTYKELFVSDAGRVVDTGNNDVSHSESQGYGLILAEANNDRETFYRIWNWTKQNLWKRNDHLFAWRWENNSPGDHVPDKNNATDGDLLIAWGLARAGSAWGDPGLQDAAREIAQDIRQKMLRPSRYGPVLLPGEYGFERAEGIIINLSYWVFPAFRELAKIDPSPVWQLLEQSGLKLVEAARFSPLGLPPEWLLVGPASLGLPEGFEAVYGYNAVRVPLYMAWAGIEPADYYASFRKLSWYALSPDRTPVPAKINLPSGNPVNILSLDKVEPALPGMLSIYKLISGGGNLDPSERPPYGPVSSGESYYSVSLGLLANCASVEWRKNRL